MRGKTIATTLQYAHNQFYSGLLQQLIRRSRLNRLLSEPYWQLVYRLSTKSKQQEIKNQTINFIADTLTEFKRFHDLSGESKVIEDVLDSLSSNDIFYDVGANVGTYTCFVASKLNSGKTVAFEPELKNATRLQENLTLNGLDAMIIKVALSNVNGTVDLALSGEEAGEGKHTIATDDDAETIKVETAKGDSIIEQRELPQPTVIKIDVEGAELSVLQGLEETLRENCRLVYVEVHPERIQDFGAQASDVTTFLEKAGFDITEIANRGDELFLRASK